MHGHGSDSPCLQNGCRACDSWDSGSPFVSQGFGSDLGLAFCLLTCLGLLLFGTGEVLSAGHFLLLDLDLFLERLAPDFAWD